MKLRILAFVLLTFGLSCSAAAQSLPYKNQTSVRYLVGATGGDSFNNTNLGVTVGVEVPFLKRFEIDLKDNFLPLETKRALGTGDANIVRSSGYVWLTNKFGFVGNAELSSYSISQVNKASIYIFGGPVIRHTFFGVPARYELDYVGQIDNHIINQFLINHNLQTGGIETAHMKGVRFAITMRAGCFSNFCIRIDEEYSLGHGLAQGDPLCDGTIGNGSQVGLSPCPRKGGLIGSVSASVRFEFPRHKGREYDLF